MLELTNMLKRTATTGLTPTEADAMRAAGAFNAALLDYVRPYMRAGLTTGEIDRLVYDYTVARGAKPATLGYHGYPYSCCTSVNEVICHGFPGKYVLQEGDIVNVDVTSIVDGWYGDQSETFLIGEVSETARRLTQCSFDSLWAAIDAITPGCRIAEVGKAVVATAKKAGFSVVEQYVGHGLGRKFHQRPNVPHVVNQYARENRLEPNTCFTIEPMINEGKPGTILDKKDGWTVRTIDGKLSAQFEHTILMTEDGPEPLTLTKLGPQKGDQIGVSA